MTTPQISDSAKEETKVLADSVGLQPTQGDSQKEKDDKLLAIWLARFKQAEDYRRAHIDRMMRLYRIYRGYRDAVNYAYGTNIMPPIGFEIVETIKPRLASANISITLQPVHKTNVDDPKIEDWNSLVDYDLSVLGGELTSFDDLKILWINAMLILGNGVAQLSWDGDENGNPYLEIVDNFLFYPDPKATNRLLDSRWEIKQIFKDKAVIVKDEEKRGEYKLYDETVLKETEDLPIKLDPRTDRTNMITQRMAQINDGKPRGQATDAGPGTTPIDKNTKEKQVEIWECWDHVENKLVVVFNRKAIARNDDNPYLNVRKGRMFIDLPNISLNWEYYAMSILEPVETTIYEIADSRNQAMDDIVFSLDPIRKIKKGKGYKPEDLKHSPGAIWELDNVDDVKIETGPGISNSWVEKDNILRNEINTSLALSEYVHGIPNSSTEPMGKVGLLLTQTNIRFSLLVRQMEIAFTDLVNGLIQMNREFLGSDKEYRITGTKVEFKEFTEDSKAIELDARVDIDSKPEKGPEQLANEAIALYKTLVVEDKPEQSATPEDITQYLRRKRAMQQILIERFGLEKYMDELLGTIQKVAPAPAPTPAPSGGAPAMIPPSPAGGIVANPPGEPMTPPTPVPIMPPEQGNTIGGSETGGGMLAQLLSKFTKK